ncbi:hypothetical protein [Pelagibius sp. Alg239-R121]|uniref:hypothetical protein n=1 Tax=Pelagibius sp. Alg239-R121 TaxID=2993448 RepID=UPI0024A68919|nr:hypothetical protein [Pelagibius sp. Alg239-R121]
MSGLECLVKRLSVCALVFSALMPGPALAQDIEGLELHLDKTIRSACHGYLVDSLPDALSWLKEKIYRNSPFCNKFLDAQDKEQLNDAVQEAYAERPLEGSRLDLSKKVDRDLNITIECRSEYMCLETRLKFLETQTPVSQEDYNTVRDYCLERYGCIQAYFRDWPAPLPTPKKLEELQIVTFDSVLDTPDQANLSGDAPDRPASTQQYPARAHASTQPSSQVLAAHGKIERLCTCSLSGRACYENPYGPVRQHIARVEAQRRQSCKGWQDQFTPIGGSGLNDDGLMSALTAKRDEIAEIDSRGKKIIALAAEDFERIRARVRNNQPFVPTLELDKIEELARGPKAQAAPSSSEAKATPSGSGSQPSGPTAIVLGPNLSWDEAGTYCRERGLRLPAVSEARGRLSELRSQDAHLGIWTAEAQYVDQYVRKYQTVRDNGFTEGENASSRHRVACFQ